MTEKFVFTGTIDNLDGISIRQVPNERCPWLMGLFSTKGEGREMRLDQQIQIGFDRSFMASRDSQILAVANAAAKTGKIRVTIDAVEDET